MRTSFVDETGARYGKLLVMARDTYTKGNGTRWLCKCECGRITSVRGADLRAGTYSSCGCTKAGKGKYVPWDNGVWKRIDQDTIECCKCGVRKSIGHKTSSYKVLCKCSFVSKRKPSVNHCCVCGAVIDKYLKKCDACKERHRLVMLPAKRSRRNASNRLRETRAKANGKIDWTVNLQDLIERDGGVCALCGEPVDANDYIMDGETFIAGNNYPSVDHIIPLSRGGCHTWNNVQLAHRVCNSRKGNAV